MARRTDAGAALIGRRFISTVLALAVLGGCAGRPEPEPPVDSMLEQHARAGRLALASEHPEQAVEQFRRALARAHERDDATAIADLGFNLAVAQLRAGHPEAALGTAQDTEAELQRRGIAPAAALTLAEAIAVYRLGRPDMADRAAAQIESAGDAQIAARASFLRGLLADERNDVPDLQRALERIPATSDPELQADAAELSARLLLRQGDTAKARAAAEGAAEQRRILLDYHSMARSLALAAHAAELAGAPEAAAALYLRAGRSAAAQHDRPAAERWLGKTIALTHDPVLARTAREAAAAGPLQE